MRLLALSGPLGRLPGSFSTRSPSESGLCASGAAWAVVAAGRSVACRFQAGSPVDHRHRFVAVAFVPLEGAARSRPPGQQRSQPRNRESLAKAASPTRTRTTLPTPPFEVGRSWVSECSCQGFWSGTWRRSCVCLGARLGRLDHRRRAILRLGKTLAVSVLTSPRRGRYERTQGPAVD